MRLSIHARLTLWFSTVLVISLAASEITVWVVLRQNLLHNLDNQLTGRLAGIQRILRNESAAGTPDQVRAELEEYAAGLTAEDAVRCWSAGSRVLYAFPSSPYRGFRFSRGDVTLSGHAYKIEVATSLRSSEAILRLLSLTMFASAPMVLLLASGGGWWLSRRALMPMDAMTREAHRLGISNLSARLPEPGTGDELDRFAQAWNRLLARLQGSVESLTRFTADASHELRSPVALIRTTAEVTLRQNRSPEQYRGALSQIESESLRMTELIENLFALARSDEGTPTLEVVRLDGVINQVRSEKNSMAESKGVSLNVDLGDAEKDVLASPAMLKILIGQLVDNAVKYTPSGGVVRVRTRDEGETATLVEVCDTGTGIKAADLPHIFERFWRADPARTVGGFGLGLSLAKAIAEAHGGKLEVKTEIERGSIFRFSLKNARFAR